MKQSSIWDFYYSKELNPENFLKQSDWLERYDEYLKNVQNELVIDLGCGEGGNAFALYNKGYQVIACDFSKIVLERIGNCNPHIRTDCFDMSKGLPYATNSIGAIIASLSTHYFNTVETKQLYNDIYRCLKLGGYFVYRVNSLKELQRNQDNIIKPLEKDFYLMRNGKKKRYFNVDSIAEFLISSGFVVLENEEVELQFNGVKKYAIAGVAKKEI